MTEPVADETRGILDGHVILSRKLASANHYPAIDVLASVSRVMDAIVDKEHRAAAGKLRELYAKYNEVELLVQLGEYKKGTDALADKAIARIDEIRKFLRQDTRFQAGFAETLDLLKKAVS
jgi:type III secretion protein N (ATPase)